MIEGFLGNIRDKNYAKFVLTLVRNYGCRMSFKLHIMDADPNIFKDNTGSFSEEHGERFYQNKSNFECRYQCQYNENMMEFYIWNLISKNGIN